MRDIRMLYLENSSVELLKRMEKLEILKDVYESFVQDPFMSSKSGPYLDNMDKKFKEYTCMTSIDCRFRQCFITDYSFLVYSWYQGVPYIQMEDRSDKWSNYMMANLQGEDREKYLKGLREFARKVAVSKEKEILESANIEQSQSPIFSLQPKNRIVDKMITKHTNKKEKTTSDELLIETWERLKEQSKDLFD